jgi:AraC-like DNA-binding protein
VTSGTHTVWRHSALRVCIALNQLGADPRPLLSNFCVSYEDLLMPGFRVSADLMGQLVTAASQLVDRKDFGLYVGQHVEPLGNTALKWSIVLSGSPAAALQRMANFSTLIDSRVSVEVKAVGNHHVLEHLPPEDLLYRGVDPLYEDFVVSGLVSLTQTLLPEGARHAAVELTQSKPDDPGPWTECFGENITWSAPTFKVWWDASLMRQQRINSNERLARAHDVLAWQQLTAQKTSTWKQRVEWLLIAELSRGPITLSAIADTLKVEVRTLQRNLKAEGTSFQELLANARKTHALNQLSCNVPIAQIGSELGYKDSSAFSNAFKIWFGVSPRNYCTAIQVS